jgi:hypothetical protein
VILLEPKPPKVKELIIVKLEVSSVNGVFKVAISVDNCISITYTLISADLLEVIISLAVSVLKEILRLLIPACNDLVGIDKTAAVVVFAEVA